MNVATLTQQLTDAFSVLQQKFKKGKAKHIKGIQAFQKYFEIVYDPNDLSLTIREIAVTLKEKVMVKLPKLRIPDYVKGKYAFTLNFHHPIFPHFPTSEMDLVFAPPFPQWFICGEFLKVHKNECLKPAQRPTKHDIYSFKDHLHVGISHVRVKTLT